MRSDGANWSPLAREREVLDAVFRADPSRQTFKTQAVQHLTEAVQDWEAYAQVASSAYRPQLLSRTHYLDWWKILEDVRTEVESVRGEQGAKQ